jgi:hypothetical protein
MRAVAEVERERQTGIAGGAEAVWAASNFITLLGRIGASAQHESAAASLAVGGGLAIRNFALDYAYQSFNALGVTHRVGIRWWVKRP